MSLFNLPPETFFLILESLADEDLAALLLAQRVCKLFHRAIQHILAHYSSRKQYGRHPTSSMNPLLQQHFANITNTVAEQTIENKFGYRIENLHDPFYNLPWLVKAVAKPGEKRPRWMIYRLPPKIRQVRVRQVRGLPHLRPEASWRRLSVTWGMDPGVRRLDVVKKTAVIGGIDLAYAQLEIPPSGAGGRAGGEEAKAEGVLTMGLFYDLMASGLGHTVGLTTGWRLLLGRRLASFDDWLRLKAREPYPDNDAITELFVPDEEGSAVLFVTGLNRYNTRTDTPSEQSGDGDDCVWKPEPIGGLPIVLHPWQGPVDRDRKYLWG